MHAAITISFTTSLTNNTSTFVTDAPRTFLMPISFVRFAMLNEIMIKVPNNTIIIDNTVARKDAFFNSSSS